MSELFQEGAMRARLLAAQQEALKAAKPRWKPHMPRVRRVKATPQGVLDLEGEK